VNKYDRKNNFWNNVDNDVDIFIRNRIRINYIIGRRRLPSRVGWFIYRIETRNNKERLEMIKLRIMNDSGHTDLVLEATGIIEQIDTHPTHWAFINGEMVAREEITNINWDEVTKVDLVPAIVGGNY